MYIVQVNKQYSVEVHVFRYDIPVHECTLEKVEIFSSEVDLGTVCIVNTWTVQVQSKLDNMGFHYRL